MSWPDPLLKHRVATVPASLLEWLQHDSWRCDHPDRYPQGDDCPCGLLSALKAAGIDPEPWRRVAG